VGSLTSRFWRNTSEPFKLRSRTYLTDKTKAASGPAMFDLVALDLLAVKAPRDHIAAVKGGTAERLLALPGARFLFIVNFQVPGTPHLSFVG
jgi:hypothetical protein